MRSLTRAEVREIDRAAIEDYGVPGVVLMENAGAGAARLLESMGITGPVIIACGKGNNGGDGFVIARHLDNAGHGVRILLACPTTDLRGDAAINLAIAEKSGLDIRCMTEADQAAWEHELADAAWIVDALLGTGLTGPPAGPLSEAIQAINAVRSRGSRVLAVDLPSGFDCDTGEPLGACVMADATATFVARKHGFDFAHSEAVTGRVRVIGIGAPRAAIAGVMAAASPATPARRQTPSTPPSP